MKVVRNAPVCNLTSIFLSSSLSYTLQWLSHSSLLHKATACLQIIVSADGQCGYDVLVLYSPSPLQPTPLRWRPFHRRLHMRSAQAMWSSANAFRFRHNTDSVRPPVAVYWFHITRHCRSLQLHAGYV